MSYRMGLLSDVPLTLEPGLDEALLSAGLPLAGGERPPDFPDDYRSARTLGEEDYDWFLEVTGDSSRDLRRQVFHTRLYTTADMREHILSALLICRSYPAVEGNGIPPDDPPRCPPGRQRDELADGGVAAAAPVQISAADRRNPVPDVLVWLLSLSTGPAGGTAVSDRDSGPGRGGKTAGTSPVAVLLSAMSFRCCWC